MKVLLRQHQQQPEFVSGEVTDRVAAGGPRRPRLDEPLADVEAPLKLRGVHAPKCPRLLQTAAA